MFDLWCIPNVHVQIQPIQHVHVSYQVALIAFFNLLFLPVQLS